MPKPNWGDIIPPFTYTNDRGGSSVYEGMNWSTDGQAVWNGGCEVDLTEPPEETTTTTTTTLPLPTTTIAPHNHPPRFDNHPPRFDHIAARWRYDDNDDDRTASRNSFLLIGSRRIGRGSTRPRVRQQGGTPSSMTSCRTKKLVPRSRAQRVPYTPIGPVAWRSFSSPFVNVRGYGASDEGPVMADRPGRRRSHRGYEPRSSGRR